MMHELAKSEYGALKAHYWEAHGSGASATQRLMASQEGCRSTELEDMSHLSIKMTVNVVGLGSEEYDGLAVGVTNAIMTSLGTDVSFADNWMRPALGVEDGMSDIAGCVTAGTSTAVGFAALQTIENVVVPAGVAAGQQFAIMTPSGAQLTIVCPAGVGPGQTISVMA